MANRAEKSGSEYYDVDSSMTRDENGLWIGDVSIRRKDTGEEVPGGYYRVSTDKEKVEQGMNENINKISSLISVPPPDWNSPVRKILARYMEVRGRVTGFGIFLEDMIQKGYKDEMLMEKFGRFCNDLTSDTIRLVREIEGLLDHERTESLTSPNDVYSNPMDPFNLDDLTARSEIFDYFIRTSPDEIRANESHNKKFKDAVDKARNDYGADDCLD